MIRLLSLAASALALLALPLAAQARDVVFLSSQLRPVESAQALRDVVLKNFPGKVDFVPELAPNLPVRLKAEQEGGQHTIDVIGGVHGELQPLVPMNVLAPLDDLAAKLAGRGIPAPLMKLGTFGTGHQLYIPWMQATYVMAANKKALPYLPAGADLNALTYDQLAQWATNIQEKTGQRMLGFPAGPTGLMNRFFEGYLYPSYTGGVVTTFRSPEAAAGWEKFASLWKTVNPNSTNYNFMEQPLSAGEVWIAFDHIARLQPALVKNPDDYVTFPAPAGPKGRGYMPVVAGLSIAKGAPDPEGAASLIDYLSRPEVQILTASTEGFFPVVKATLPPDLPAGVKLIAQAVDATQNAKDAVPSLLPVGLGTRGGEFDKVYMDTFQLIVLRGQKPQAVLDREAPILQKIMTETGAPCWAPDPASQGACQVK